MYLMQSILVESLLCCNLPEGAFYMLVRLAQPSRNVFEQPTSWLQQLQAVEAKSRPEKQSESVKSAKGTSFWAAKLQAASPF